MRRILFGLFWFGVLWLAIMVVGGGIAGATRVTVPPPPGEGVREGERRRYDPGGEGVGEFRDRYGTLAVGIAAVLAVLGTCSGVLPGTRSRR